MFVALWEYEVKPGGEKRFENGYGPEGGWTRLFRSDANYRETRLLRDPFRPAIYLTLDFWNSREANRALRACFVLSRKQKATIREFRRSFAFPTTSE